MREKTMAHRRLKDDVPPEVKKVRLQKMIDTFLEAQLERTSEEIGRYHLVLVDSSGKKEGQLKGKTDTYRSVLFSLQTGRTVKIEGKESFRQACQQTEGWESHFETEEVKKGDYVIVKIDRVSSNSLFGTAIGKVSFNGFFEISNGNHFFTDESVN